MTAYIPPHQQSEAALECHRAAACLALASNPIKIAMGVMGSVMDYLSPHAPPTSCCLPPKENMVASLLTSSACLANPILSTSLHHLNITAISRTWIRAGGAPLRLPQACAVPAPQAGPARPHPPTQGKYGGLPAVFAAQAGPENVDAGVWCCRTQLRLSKRWQCAYSELVSMYVKLL